MTHIDFIGIGAPKCGTTWFSAQLEGHPQIGFTPDKEVYYFADTILRRIAGQELRCFERGESWYHEQFPAAVGAISCRGEFCPAYLYSEVAAARIAAYGPDMKLLLCLRPPVEMIYSWYWYNRNAVVASLPDSFEEMMENSFLRDLGCFARHLRPWLDRFPAKNILVVQFDAIPTASASAPTSFWASPQISSRSFPSRGRIPPGLLALPSSNPAPSVST